MFHKFNILTTGNSDFLLPSCDSDFFVNDVAFLPLDSLEWEDVLMDVDGGPPYLRCRQFDRPRFLSRHGLEEKRMLPLMSAVLGNDYVPLETFSGFFAQVVSHAFFLKKISYINYLSKKIMKTIVANRN